MILRVEDEFPDPGRLNAYQAERLSALARERLAGRSVAYEGTVIGTSDNPSLRSYRRDDREAYITIAGSHTNLTVRGVRVNVSWHLTFELEDLEPLLTLVDGDVIAGAATVTSVHAYASGSDRMSVTIYLTDRRPPTLVKRVTATE